MASFVYNGAARAVADGTLNLVADTIKVMLVTSGYAADRDDTALTAAAAAEIAVGGYAGGYGGAGRQSLASKAFVTDTGNDRVEWGAANLTWTALASGATIAAAVVVKEITNDASSLPIAFLDIADTATNGGDFGLTFDAEGIIQWRTA